VTHSIRVEMFTFVYFPSAFQVIVDWVILLNTYKPLTKISVT